jgi:hypothetical protein
MLQQIPPVISTITKDNLEQLRSIDFPSAVAFIEEDDKESRTTFASIAEAYHEQILFGISSDLTLAKVGSVKPPFIVLHSHSDHIDRLFSEPFDIDKVRAFFNGISTPLIGKFSMESYYAYTQVSFYSQNSAGGLRRWRTRLTTLNSPSYPSSTSSPQLKKSGNLLQRLSGM